VNKVVNDVEEAVVSVREAEESWRGEMREIRGEVESVRELVPRVSLPSWVSPISPPEVLILPPKCPTYLYLDAGNGHIQSRKGLMITR
jgi:hypothetical protein